MQLKDLTPSFLNQVIELENQNILPVLRSVNIKMTPDEMRSQIYKMMDHFIIFDSDQEIINGFIIYKVKESSLVINSFNVKVLNNYQVLSSLLKQVVKDLCQLNIQDIQSKAHKTNKNSLNFHRNMGFKEVKQTSTEVEFTIQKYVLLKKIESRVFRQD